MITKLAFSRFMIIATALLFPLQNGAALAANGTDSGAAINDTVFYEDCGTSTTPAAQPAATPAPTKYIRAGNVLATGEDVGANVFGGAFLGDSWAQNDNISTTGGDGKPLPGRTAYAELDGGNALGGIPNGTKLEISFTGAKIIAVKTSNGPGGPDVSGRHLSISLWWETAQLLNFREATDVVSIRPVDPNTPVSSLAATPQDKAKAEAPPPSSSCCDQASAPSSVTLTGGDNPAKVYNFLVTTGGFKPFQAAGIMGSMQVESNFDPTIVQGGGHANSPPPGAIGYGIVQWTPGTQILPAPNPGDLGYQLQYLMKQLNGSEKAAGDAVRGATDIAGATSAFELKFERHAGGPQPDRLKNAQGYLAKYGNGATSGSASSGPGTQDSLCGATGGGPCINPIQAGKWIPARTDQGVDWQPIAPTPVLAICDGTVIQADVQGTGWPGGVFIRYKVSGGDHAGKIVYVSEHLVDLKVKVGQAIKAGDTIATALPGYPWTEWGWAAEDSPNTPVTRGDGETPGGKAFARWLIKLGAKPMSDPGPGPEYP